MTGLSFDMLRGVIIHKVDDFNIANLEKTAKFLRKAHQAATLKRQTIHEVSTKERKELFPKQIE